MAQAEGLSYIHQSPILHHAVSYIVSRTFPSNRPDFPPSNFKAIFEGFKLGLEVRAEI